MSPMILAVFFFQAEDGIRDYKVTGVQTCALPILLEGSAGGQGLVVVNLYPFRETLASGASFEQTIEMVDIGGPAMVRAAAKNFGGVGVVVDPGDYAEVLSALEEGGGILPEELRRRLAAKAFGHTQSYDAAVANFLEGGDRLSLEL